MRSPRSPCLAPRTTARRSPTPSTSMSPCMPWSRRGSTKSAAGFRLSGPGSPRRAGRVRRHQRPEDVLRDPWHIRPRQGPGGAAARRDLGDRNLIRAAAGPAGTNPSCTGRSSSCPSADGPGTCWRRRSMRTRRPVQRDLVEPAGLAAAHAAAPSGKPRARSIGLPFGGRPGRWNAITDVPGGEVGYTTLIMGDSIRTGVTAIHPRGAAEAGDPVAAGFFSQNGKGEMTGVSWIEESGTFSGPVAITNTHAVGVAHAAIVAWTVRHHPRLADAWLLPVAAETWDGYLNDINGHHVTEQVVIEALEAAAAGPVDEGSVGGGTGMNCYQSRADRAPRPGSSIMRARPM